MEFKLTLVLVLLAFGLISITEGQVFKTDLTLEVLCKELKDKAKDSQEYKMFCTTAKGPMRPDSSLTNLPKRGR